MGNGGKDNMQYYMIKGRRHYVADELASYIESQGFEKIYSCCNYDKGMEIYYKSPKHKLVAVTTEFGVLTGNGLKNLSTMIAYTKIPQKYKCYIPRKESGVIA